MNPYAIESIYRQTLTLFSNTSEPTPLQSVSYKASHGLVTLSSISRRNASKLCALGARLLEPAREKHFSKSSWYFTTELNRARCQTSHLQAATDHYETARWRETKTARKPRVPGRMQKTNSARQRSAEGSGSSLLWGGQDSVTFIQRWTLRWAFSRVGSAGGGSV